MEPTHWTGTHKQAVQGRGDAPLNSLASPYQIACRASSIVQLWAGETDMLTWQLKPDFIYLKISHCLTQLFSNASD